MAPWRRRGGRALRATVGALRRGADLIPLTPRGVLLGLGGWAALSWVAYPEIDLVWLVLGFGALGLLAASVVAVLIGAAWLKVATRPPRGETPERTLETGRWLPTGVDAPHLGLLPLAQARWSWLAPDGAEVALRRQGLWRLAEEVRLSSRGRSRTIRRRIEVRDAFGLAAIAIRQVEPVDLTVQPHVGRLRAVTLLSSMAGGDERPHPMGVDDGDRTELRRYVPGDPARFIHWKVFGRTRRLMVRVPERALSPARRTLAYLVAGPGDEGTAAAARVALEGDTLGTEWAFGADGSAGSTSRVDEGLRRIVDAAAHRDDGGAGLEAFLSAGEAAGPASAVLFVPPQPGPWLARAVGAARARAARTRFVVGTDGVSPRSERRTPLKRLLTLGRPRRGTPEEDLAEVLRALGATRAEVIVVDRPSGRRLGPTARRAASATEPERRRMSTAA
ncbi:MAG: DUF58 domain-containing protein [Sandaracinaceae bacterium]